MPHVWPRIATDHSVSPRITASIEVSRMCRGLSQFAGKACHSASLSRRRPVAQLLGAPAGCSPAPERHRGKGLRHSCAFKALAASRAWLGKRAFHGRDGGEFLAPQLVAGDNFPQPFFGDTPPCVPHPLALALWCALSDSASCVMPSGKRLWPWQVAQAAQRCCLASCPMCRRMCRCVRNSDDA